MKKHEPESLFEAVPDAVLIVYLAVNLISWRLDGREAGEINKTLKALQGRK